MGNKVEKINLQASLRVPRMAKNGEDGIGILSADVVFAVGKSNTDSSDIKDTAWRTTVAQLTLQKGYYVWSCTLVTLTGNAGKRYTGKYCLGECYDFAEVTELYALTDSGTQQPDDNASTWTASYQPTKGKYLWTCSRVKYSNSDSYSYLNKKCIAYFPKDGTNGTSFTPQGTAKAHYEKSSQIPGGYKAGEVYIVDSHDAASGAIAAPCVIIILELTTGKYTFGVKKASAGDAYNVDGELWVNKGEKWVDFGSCQGPKGDDGAVLSLFVTPTKFTFKVNKDGTISQEHNHFYYYGRFGDTMIIDTTEGATWTLLCPDGCNFTNTNDNANAGLHEIGNSEGFINTAGISKYTYDLGGGITKDAYCTSAYIVVQLTYKGFTIQQRIDLEADMSLFGAVTISNDELFQRNMASLTSQVTEQGQKITQANSQIQQTSKQIATLVTTTDGLSKRTSTLEQNASDIKARVDAVDKQGKMTQAELDMCVEKQADGTYVSKMQVNADDVNINANHKLAIKGDYFTFEATNGSLSEDGILKTKNSEFDNVKVNGSVRSDYSVVKSGMEDLNVDNICIQSEDWFSFYQLKWDASQIGRTMRIANYTDNGVIFSAPSSDKWFITNGQHVGLLAVAPRRCLVLHGFGYEGKFIAWCVENSYSYLNSLPKYDMRYLAKGMVIYTSNTQIEIRQKTIGGNITVQRMGTGLYRLSLPTLWSAAFRTSSELLVYQIGVMLTGFGYSKDDGQKALPIKATVKDIGWADGGLKTQMYIDVWTSDDATVNDGDFQFLIYSLNSNLDE